MLRKREGERGAVTLFVLIAILFFVIILLSLFVANSNRNNSQLSEIKKIEENYSVHDIDDVYKEALNKFGIFINLYRESRANL